MTKCPQCGSVVRYDGPKSCADCRITSETWDALTIPPQHTPTPLLMPLSQSCGDILDAKGNIIFRGQSLEDWEEKASLIVRAVNAHEENTRLLKMAYERIHHIDADGKAYAVFTVEEANQLKAAIAKASPERSEKAEGR